MTKNLDNIPQEWAELLNDFQQKMSTGQAMGTPEKLAKRQASGLLNARQRLAILVDEGSFTELGTLVGGVSAQGLPPAPADALVGGIATIEGRSVVVGSEDASVQGGSIGFGTHAKRIRLVKLAEREQVPLIMLLDGAGERASNGLQRHPYAPNDLQAMATLSHQVPTIALVMGASAGHGALTGLLSDIVIMVEGAALFSAGPPLVKQALGEDVSKEELGGASIHSRNGVAHHTAQTEEQALDIAKQYLSYLPRHAKETVALQKNNDAQPRLLDQVLQIVPRANMQAYDIKMLIEHMVDRDTFLEFQQDYGCSIVTGFARMGGRSIAIVANQPLVMAGSVTREAAEKAAYFIDLVGAYQLPVIFLADNPGVMSGSQAEKAGTLRAAATMYAAQSKLRSPKLHVTLRKAFGFGSSIMAMNPFDQQTMTLAFPGVSLGGMPASGGGQAAKMSPEEQKMIEQYEREAWSKVADTMAYDEIIDPRELRNKLLAGLQLSQP